MRLFQVGIITLAALWPYVCPAQQHELTFSAEINSIHNPVQIPSDALTVLKNDKDDFPNGASEHLRCSDHEKNEPSEQILCTTLPLSSSPGTDYLIIGVGDLRGAHIVPLWIIHTEIGTPVLIFKTHADTLTILPSAHKGHRDLMATFIFGAGTTIQYEHFLFDGKSYKLSSTKETHN
ncbi:hypothetical protein [Tunturiibacter psychrotolerans]|uniref:hypothetical protein n=1 Tax=Tunturiibacter psychrotolerans TaxID=3069686 RepID=UPI003D1A1D5E